MQEKQNGTADAVKVFFKKIKNYSDFTISYMWRYTFDFKKTIEKSLKHFQK